MAHTSTHDMLWEPEPPSQSKAAIGDDQITEVPHDTPQDTRKRKLYNAEAMFYSMAKRRRPAAPSPAFTALGIQTSPSNHSDVDWLTSTTPSSTEIGRGDHGQDPAATLDQRRSTAQPELDWLDDTGAPVTTVQGTAAPQSQKVRPQQDSPAITSGQFHNHYNPAFVESRSSQDGSPIKQGNIPTSALFDGKGRPHVAASLFASKGDSTPDGPEPITERQCFSSDREEVWLGSLKLQAPISTPRVTKHHGDVSPKLSRHPNRPARSGHAEETLVMYSDSSQLGSGLCIADSQKCPSNLAVDPIGHHSKLPHTQLPSLYVRCSIDECDSRHQVCAAIDDQPACLGCFSRWAYHPDTTPDDSLTPNLVVTPSLRAITATCENSFCTVNILLSDEQCEASLWKMQVHDGISLCGPCGLFYERHGGAMRPQQKCRLDQLGLALESVNSPVCRNSNCNWDSALGHMIEIRGTNETVRVKADKTALAQDTGFCLRCQEHWLRNGTERPKDTCDKMVADLMLRFQNPGRWDGLYTRLELLDVRRRAYAINAGMRLVARSGA
ncbi:hypothetical protein EDD37DRAFT_693724 [Exophiala viscosa]|uniref:uncharacterized protein n=1 Tax=Exophiala viscosa TaxID=2486360 RepID=UPI0021A209DD|nr:hypothetical protein EDD37DRAFT_693724 [Exophiala viscosa]